MGIAAEDVDLPVECPYRAYLDPFVIEVARCYRWWAVGELRMRVGANPPAVLVEALDLYAREVGNAEAHALKKRTPPPSTGGTFTG